MAHPYSSHLMDVLLYQGEEDSPEIRALSLATLNDSDLLSGAALIWTQVGWFWTLAVTGCIWLFAFIAVDLVMFGIRWRLRRGLTPKGRPLDTRSQTLSAWVNLLFVVLISIDIFILAQVPSERTSIFAIIGSVGFCGYVTAIFAAFPALATLNIVLLNAGMGLGLAIGFSDTARPFALLSIYIAFGFWFLMRRTYVALLGAIRAQHASRQLSLHDPLTKLANRTAMREKLAYLLSASATQDAGCEVAVLCIDLDGFKTINDRYGHAAGDWVLIHVADIMRRHLPAGGFACRIGGDEYVILLSGLSGDQVQSFGRTLIAAIEQPFDIGRTVPARVGASIGAAITTHATESLDVLLEKADAALYDAKRAGKGHLSFGTPSACVMAFAS